MVNIFFIILYMILISYLAADISISLALKPGWAKLAGIAVMSGITYLNYGDMPIDIRSISALIWIAFITNIMIDAMYRSIGKVVLKNISEALDNK